MSHYKTFYRNPISPGTKRPGLKEPAGASLIEKAGRALSRLRPALSVWELENKLAEHEISIVQDEGVFFARYGHKAHELESETVDAAMAEACDLLTQGRPQ